MGDRSDDPSHHERTFRFDKMKCVNGTQTHTDTHGEREDWVEVAIITSNWWSNDWSLHAIRCNSIHLVSTMGEPAESVR